jgi:hypothetical protein
MKKILSILTFTLLVNVVAGQDIYSCYKIENKKFDNKSGQFIVIKTIYDIDMPIIIDNEKIIIRSDVFRFTNSSNIKKTKYCNIKTWNCFNFYKKESSFVSLKHYTNDKGQIGFIQLEVLTKKGVEKYLSIYTLRRY